MFAIATLLTLATLGTKTASAKGVPVFDDFEDLDYKNPIAWLLESEGPVTMSAESGDLVVTPLGSFNALWVGPLSPDYEKMQDASVRTQVRLSGTGEWVWLWSQARFGDADGNKWVAGILYRNANLRLEHNRSNPRPTVQTDFRVAEEDVVLQLDVIGTKASLYAWRPGEPMPETPQVSIDLPSVQPGILGGGMNGPDAGTSLTFRYLIVDAKPIRDIPAMPKLRIHKNAVLLSYPSGGDAMLESRDTRTPFGIWKRESQPSLMIGNERRVGFTSEEAEGKEFRLTGVDSPKIAVNRKVVLFCYPLYFNHWQLENHSTLNKAEFPWLPVETVIVGGDRRVFVPAMKPPAEFFRLRRP